MSNDASVPELTDVPPALQAAIELWEHLAAFAWAETLAYGRGILLAREAELLAAAQAKQVGRPVEMPLSFVPMLEVPSGDDFLHVISKYDVKRQIVLLVGREGRKGAEDDEQLFVLEANEKGRPLPEQCLNMMLDQG